MQDTIYILPTREDGLTTPQIAERLVVSLPTVNTHVASIFDKLGVSSRSAATRYAVEHHLVLDLATLWRNSPPVCSYAVPLSCSSFLASRVHACHLFVLIPLMAGLIHSNDI